MELIKKWAKGLFALSSMGFFFVLIAILETINTLDTTFKKGGTMDLLIEFLHHPPQWLMALASVLALLFVILLWYFGNMMIGKIIQFNELYDKVAGPQVAARNLLLQIYFNEQIKTPEDIEKWARLFYGIIRPNELKELGVNSEIADKITEIYHIEKAKEYAKKDP